MKYLLVVFLLCGFSTETIAQVKVYYKCSCNNSPIVEAQFLNELRTTPGIELVSEDEGYNFAIQVVATPLTIEESIVGYVYTTAVVVAVPLDWLASEAARKMLADSIGLGAYVTHYVSVSGRSLEELRDAIAKTVDALYIEIFKPWFGY